MSACTPLNAIVRSHLDAARVYRPERRVWVTPILTFGIMSVALGMLSMAMAPDSGLSPLLLPSCPLAVLALILVRLAGLRLRLGANGFEYRDIFGKNIALKYSDVTALTTKSVAAGRGGIYFRATFHLRDGGSLNANLFPFGREVYRLLQSSISGT